ncbi:MAG: hypothetical protein ACHQF2_01465 [Flavobacteriales bacterium]
MKKLLLLLLTSVPVTSLNAQFGDAKWSEIRKSPDSFVLLALSEDAASSAYALHGNHEKKPTRFLLEVFDEDMNAKESIEFTLPVSEEGSSRYLGAHSFGSDFYIFATYIDKSNTAGPRHYVFAYKVTSQGIVDKTELTHVDFTNGLPTGDFKIAFSTSGDYYCILSEHPVQEGANELVTISVFGPSNKAVFSKELPLDVTFKKNIHNYIFCTNAGGAYLVKKDKEKNVFRYLAYSIELETTSLSGKVILIPNRHVTDIRVQVTETGHLYLGGFTSTEPVHEYTGYFLFGFDAALNTTFRTTGTFDEYTLELMLGKKGSKSAVLRGFYIDRIVTVGDGTTYLLAEEQTHSKGEKKEEHAYGNILVLAFAKEGKYKKSYCIKKSQNTSFEKSDFASYAVWIKKDTIYLGFNDVTSDLIAKNESSKISDKSFLKSHIVTASYETGMVDNTWIEKFTDNDISPLAFEPSIIFVNKKNELFMRFLSPDQKFYRLAKMALK